MWHSNLNILSCLNSSLMNFGSNHELFLLKYVTEMVSFWLVFDLNKTDVGILRFARCTWSRFEFCQTKRKHEYCLDGTIFSKAIPEKKINQLIFRKFVKLTWKKNKLIFEKSWNWYEYCWRGLIEHNL